MNMSDMKLADKVFAVNPVPSRWFAPLNSPGLDTDVQKKVVFSDSHKIAKKFLFS
jgi:hypothetical protein